MHVTLTLRNAGATLAQMVSPGRFLLQHSLTRRLLLLQVAACLLMLATLFFGIWQVSMSEAKQEALRNVRQLMYILIDLQDPAVAAPRLLQRVERTFDEEGDADLSDVQLRYEIRDVYGTVLARSRVPPRPLPLGWSGNEFHSPESGRSVFVAVNERGVYASWRADVMSLMWQVALTTIVLIVPIAVLASVLLTRFGLAPVRELSRTIALRTPDNLAPIATPRRYSELTPLLNELNRLLEKLRHAQSGERRFFADAAHELLTPVTAIRAQGHLLATAPDSSARVRAHVDLEGGLQRITTLIRQMLTIARLGSRELQLNLTRQDLLPLTQERLGLAAARAIDKGIDLALQAPRECICVFDRDTFATVLDNLIDNAIRYLPAGSRIKVSLRKRARAVWIAVADDGPGIPIEYRNKVFERFFRVPGNREPGSGLGLSIVARTVALHEGVVMMRDGLGRRGVTAFIRLPAPST